VDPAFETPVFLAEQVQTPRADREAKTSMAFNNFNVPAFYLQSSEFMAMFASGRTSGLVVSSGMS
jgi:actin-related protein